MSNVTPSRRRSSQEEKQIELLMAQTESAIRDLKDFRCRVVREFKQLFSMIHDIHNDSVKIHRLQRKNVATWRQHPETVNDLNSLTSLANSVEWDLSRFKEMLWRSSDVIDCGLTQSAMNAQNIHRTLNNSWECVVHEFNLNWKERDEELMAEEEPSNTSDGHHDDGWEPPAEESMDAVGNVG